jgi:hypothetical protein
MGGGAFQDTARLDQAAQARVEALVLQILRAHGLSAASPLELADKVSFGDVDICVLEEEGYDINSSPALTDLNAALGVTEPPVRSGHVLSLLTAERYQVDLLICHNKAKYPAMCQYLSHGDLSNILGLALTKWHLKLGLEGLFVKIRASDVVRYGNLKELHEQDCTPTRLLEAVQLSQNVNSVNTFLGLPPTLSDAKTRFKMSDLFEAISGTPFVSAADFPLSGHKFKHRKGRPMFTAFAAYAVAHPHIEYDAALRSQFESNSFVWKMAVARRFGCEEAMEARLELLVQIAQRKALTRLAKAKFSARTIMAWYPALQDARQKDRDKGRAIGRMLHKLKQQVAGGSDVQYARWILATEMAVVKIKCDAIRLADYVEEREGGGQLSAVPQLHRQLSDGGQRVFSHAMSCSFSAVPPALTRAATAPR